MTSDLALEIVDNATGQVYRRVVVGPLDTNCWIVADAATRDAIVIDPGDDSARLIDAAAEFSVIAIILTHAHWDHVLALPTVADAWGCAVHQHPDEAPVWPHELAHLREHGHFDAGTATSDLLACGCTLAPPRGADLWNGRTQLLDHGQLVHLGDRSIQVVHTPGHTPGGVSLISGTHVFGGDTLFPGGPGLTGWPLSDFSTIIESIRRELFSLGDHVEVHPGHGRSTTIGDERPHLDEWIARGW